MRQASQLRSASLCVGGWRGGIIYKKPTNTLVTIDIATFRDTHTRWGFALRVAVREGGFPSVFVRLSHGRTVCPRYRSPTFSVNAMVISVAVWRLWCRPCAVS